jgi:DNA-binding CsgD family transcriptional regulator
MLASAAQVKILVTSREKLNLQGEILYHLEGLQLPPSAESIESYDAIQLFFQRARQARPGFQASEQDVQQIVHICQLVQGMPLGILLAAAWLEHFSPREIVQQIEHSLDFLAQEFRDLPTRHRSLRAVFDSSFEQLDQDRRTVFSRLAVFRGDFSSEAAKEVAGADLKTLLVLVEKSLLHRNIDTGRYDFHELLRQYASEKLVEAENAERLDQIHADYYLGLIHRLKKQLKSPMQSAALDTVQSDFGNITQAWKWAAERRDFRNIELAASPLYAFCDMRSRYFEGEVLFGLARQALAPRTDETPHAVWSLILLSWYDLFPVLERGQIFNELSSQANLCLKQAKIENNAESMAASLVLLGAISGDRGDQDAAIRFYREGMALCPRLDDFYWINMRIGLAYQSLREYENAISSFNESLARGQVLGERVKMGWSLLNMGNTLFMAGKRVEAERDIQKAMALFEEVGTSMGLMWGNYIFGELAFANGNREMAKMLALKALELAHQIHSPMWVGKADNLLQRIESKSSSSKPVTVIEPLSERELEVLKLLQSDLDGPEIAQRLFVSLNTVRYHTKNIYRKLQVNNRLEAIRRARELNI